MLRLKEYLLGSSDVCIHWLPILPFGTLRCTWATRLALRQVPPIEPPWRATRIYCFFAATLWLVGSDLVSSLA